MIAIICLLTVLRLSNCLEELPTVREIETSINRTIEEVERMVKSDPSLPRLSRNEIVDILINITSRDMNRYEKRVEKARENYQRALMVVLPYNSKDSKDQSLEDLYTKVPKVEIVEDSSERLETTVETSDNLINTMTRKNEELSDESRYKNHRDTYTEISSGLPTEETLRLLLSNDKNEDTEPEKFSFNLEKLGTKKESSTGSFFENFFKDRTTPASKSNLEIVYSTSVTERSTSGSRDMTTISVEGFRPTLQPGRSTANILTSDQWRYNAPPSPTTSGPRQPLADPKNHEKSTTLPFLPTIRTLGENDDSETSATRNPESASGRLTNRQMDSPWSMEHLRIVNENERPAPYYVTPMSTTSGKLGGSLVTANDEDATKTPMPMREEVQDLLASIGLHPKNGENRNKNNYDHEKIFGTNFQIPDSSNVIVGQASALTAVGVESPSISGQNTFESTPQDVKKGVDNLSPDVQLLFQRFGLQSSAKDREISMARITTQKPTVLTTRTSFWNNFKPIPASQVKDAGMKDFLAKFGLGVENRSEKSMTMRKENEKKAVSLIEAVPGDMKPILENIGLITRTQRLQESTIIGTTETPLLHVFKPHEASIENEKQRAKINQLLDTVKLVQQGKSNVLAVQKVARELLETTKSLKNGPDPLSLEEILKMYNEDVKNEIKRQQDPKDLGDMAISGIKRLMIYALGTTELWVGRILGGLTRLKNVLTNVTNKLMLSDHQALHGDPD